MQPMMCLVIYACKCDVPKDKLEKDLYDVYEELRRVKHDNPLTEEDVRSALETYDREYYNFTIADIEKLTDIRIERNKRNHGVTQQQHLYLARSRKKEMKHIGLPYIINAHICKCNANIICDLEDCLFI